MRNAALLAPLPAPFARVAGPLATAALAAIIELLAGTPLHVPSPAALFVLAVVLAAFSGGIVPGLIRAAIASAYTAYFFSEPRLPFEHTDDNLRRVVIWVVAPFTFS